MKLIKQILSNRFISNPLNESTEKNGNQSLKFDIDVNEVSVLEIDKDKVKELKRTLLKQFNHFQTRNLENKIFLKRINSAKSLNMFINEHPEVLLILSNQLIQIDHLPIEFVKKLKSWSEDSSNDLSLNWLNSQSVSKFITNYDMIKDHEKPVSMFNTDLFNNLSGYHQTVFLKEYSLLNNDNFFTTSFCFYKLSNYDVYQLLSYVGITFQMIHSTLRKKEECSNDFLTELNILILNEIFKTRISVFFSLMLQDHEFYLCTHNKQIFYRKFNKQTTWDINMTDSRATFETDVIKHLGAHNLEKNESLNRLYTGNYETGFNDIRVQLANIKRLEIRKRNLNLLNFHKIKRISCLAKREEDDLYKKQELNESKLMKTGNNFELKVRTIMKEAFENQSPMKDILNLIHQEISLGHINVEDNMVQSKLIQTFHPLSISNFSKLSNMNCYINTDLNRLSNRTYEIISDIIQSFEKRGVSKEQIDGMDEEQDSDFEISSHTITELSENIYTGLHNDYYDDLVHLNVFEPLDCLHDILNLFSQEFIEHWEEIIQNTINSFHEFHTSTPTLFIQSISYYLISKFETAPLIEEFLLKDCSELASAFFNCLMRKFIFDKSESLNISLPTKDKLSWTINPFYLLYLGQNQYLREKPKWKAISFENLGDLSFSSLTNIMDTDFFYRFIKLKGCYIVNSLSLTMNIYEKLTPNVVQQIRNGIFIIGTAKSYDEPLDIEILEYLETAKTFICWINHKEIQSLYLPSGIPMSKNCETLFCDQNAKYEENLSTLPSELLPIAKVNIDSCRIPDLIPMQDIHQLSPRFNFNNPTNGRYEKNFCYSYISLIMKSFNQLDEEMFHDVVGLFIEEDFKNNVYFVVDDNNFNNFSIKSPPFYYHFIKFQEMTQGLEKLPNRNKEYYLRLIILHMLSRGSLHFPNYYGVQLFISPLYFPELDVREWCEIFLLNSPGIRLDSYDCIQDLSHIISNYTILETAGKIYEEKILKGSF